MNYNNYYCYYHHRIIFDDADSNYDWRRIDNSVHYEHLLLLFDFVVFVVEQLVKLGQLFLFDVDNYSVVIVMLLIVLEQELVISVDELYSVD